MSLLAASSLVALVVAELGLRLFSARYYPIIPAAYEYDADTAFRLRPGAHLLATTDHQQESIANGLGSANFQEQFDDYPSLVFAVGDSYTQGAGVPADMSYPAQLDLILNQDEDGVYVKRFGVVNLGVAGFGGEQSLRRLRAWGTQMRAPATILYLGCDNDFGDDLAFLAGDRHRLVLAGSPVWGNLAGPGRWFLEDTQIGLLVRVTHRERSRRRLIADAMRQRPDRPPVAALESGVLEQMADYARQHGSRLIVGWSEETDSYPWLKAWAAAKGIGFADWVPPATSVRAALPGLSLENQHSGGHHRAWVNGIIAGAFARQIRGPGPRVAP